tara:strand:+ start:1538 stop:1840 length:303 start_codon:yes stop_codon:yes gene_type:complete
MMFTDDLAERLKARAGEKYQPSNGTEGHIFMEGFCFRCALDNFDEDSGKGGCDILARSFLPIEAEEYPGEWQYGDDGQPKCTAFSAASPSPEPAEDGSTP